MPRCLGAAKNQTKHTQYSWNEARKTWIPLQNSLIRKIGLMASPNKSSVQFSQHFARQSQKGNLCLYFNFVHFLAASKVKMIHVAYEPVFIFALTAINELKLIEVRDSPGKFPIFVVFGIYTVLFSLWTKIGFEAEFLNILIAVSKIVFLQSQ